MLQKYDLITNKEHLKKICFKTSDLGRQKAATTYASVFHCPTAVTVGTVVMTLFLLVNGYFVRNTPAFVS